MYKTVSILALALLSMQPAQGMSANKARSNAAQRTTQLNAGQQDALLIGGALTAGAALVYLLYRSNYRSSLKEARASLDAMQKQYAVYCDSLPRFRPDTIQSREDATPVYHLLVSAESSLNEIARETRKHKTAWQGYPDYDHTQADYLIQQAQVNLNHVARVKKDLDHHVAKFVFSETTKNLITEIEGRYQQNYNPLVNVVDLASAQTFQKQLTSDKKTVEAFQKDLRLYCRDYATYAHHQVDLAEYLLEKSDSIYANIVTTQKNLSALIAKYQLAELYCAVDAQFRSQLNQINQPFALETKIHGICHKEQYPLLAYTEKIEDACKELRAQADRVSLQFAEKDHAGALADELDALIKAVAGLPAYAEQKKEKKADEQRTADRLLQEKLAREKREADDRRAREERESKERIARQDREAKAAHDARIARAHEQAALASREKAAAEERKARAEEARVRIERERLELEKLKAAGTLKPALSIPGSTGSATINIHVRGGSTWGSSADNDDDIAPDLDDSL